MMYNQNIYRTNMPGRNADPGLHNGMSCGTNSGTNHRRQKRRKFMKLRNMMLTVTLMGSLIVGSVMAFLIDVDSKDGQFFFSGKDTIDISLIEEKFDAATHNNVMPNEKYEKDPLVSNIGTAPAYVFMQVEVPTARVETVNAAGVKQAAAEQELFKYTVASTSGWTEIGEAFTKTVEDGANIENYKVYTYVYGDSMECTSLRAEGSTPTLFDEVQVINYVGANTINGSEKHIKVTAYAIQTNGLDSTDPDDVWSVLASQAGAATDSDTD